MRKMMVAVVAALALAACDGGGQTCGNCQAGSNYCRDPGGNGADVCCPSSTPYYCATDKLCHGSVFTSCAAGKVFCSVEYNC